MEFLFVIVGIFLLIGLYFWLGVVVQFLWGWLPMALGLLVAVAVGVSGGWIAGILGVFLALLSILGADAWHRTALYQRVESLIAQAFYFDE